MRCTKGILGLELEQEGRVRRVVGASGGRRASLGVLHPGARMVRGTTTKYKIRLLVE